MAGTRKISGFRSGYLSRFGQQGWTFSMLRQSGRSHLAVKVLCSPARVSWVTANLEAAEGKNAGLVKEGGYDATLRGKAAIVVKARNLLQKSSCATLWRIACGNIPIQRVAMAARSFKVFTGKIGSVPEDIRRSHEPN